MDGSWPRLRLTWGSEPEKRQHIILLYEAGNFLLANLDEPTRTINKFAEYAEEKPVKARPYAEIWADLVGGTS